MFTIIGLALGGFVGYLASGFLDGLQPLQDSAKKGVSNVLALIGGLLSKFTSGFAQASLIHLAIMIVVALLLVWLMGFSMALLIGFIGGLIYSDEVGRLPLVSGFATTIREKLSGQNKPKV